MNNLAEQYPLMVETKYLGPAYVLRVDESGERVYLRLTGPFENIDVWARLAVPAPFELNPGDKVLAVGEKVDELYVIGLLNRMRDETSLPKKITLQGGTYAETGETPEAQSLKVFSKSHELIFEYDENSGKAKVNLESGDLEFATKNGNIAFVAGQDILLNGQSVGITSRSGIIMGIMDIFGKIQSAITLKPQNMKLSSGDVGIEAQRGEFQIEETNYIGKKLSGKIGYTKLAMDRLETVVDTVIGKAKNVYKTVEQLSQLKAGRMRTLIDSTFHLKSKKSFLKSEKDFKIRADKIHLG